MLIECIQHKSFKYLNPFFFIQINLDTLTSRKADVNEHIKKFNSFFFLYGLTILNILVIFGCPQHASTVQMVVKI